MKIVMIIIIGVLIIYLCGAYALCKAIKFFKTYF